MKFKTLTKKEAKVLIAKDAFKILDIDPKLRTKDMWLSAVHQNGMVLEVAPYNIKADRAVVLQAVKSWPTAIIYANPKYLEDLEIALCVARRNPRRIKYFVEDVRDHPKVIDAIINFKGSRYNTDFQEV